MGQPLSLVVYGSSLGKTSERFVVKKLGKVIEERPFFRVSEIIIPSRGVMLSAAAVYEATTPTKRGLKRVDPHLAQLRMSTDENLPDEEGTETRGRAWRPCRRGRPTRTSPTKRGPKQ